MDTQGETRTHCDRGPVAYLWPPAKYPRIGFCTTDCDGTAKARESISVLLEKQEGSVFAVADAAAVFSLKPVPVGVAPEYQAIWTDVSAGSDRLVWRQRNHPGPQPGLKMVNRLDRRCFTFAMMLRCQPVSGSGLIAKV